MDGLLFVWFTRLEAKAGVKHIAKRARFMDFGERLSTCWSSLEPPPPQFRPRAAGRAFRFFPATTRKGPLG